MQKSFPKVLRYLLAVGLALPISLKPCGPFFPNTMLPGDDATLLAAPISSFDVELSRISIPPSSFTAVARTNTLAEETLNAELADLQRAGVSADTTPRLIEFRRQLQHFVQQMDEWKSQSSSNQAEAAASDRPALGPLECPTGLPVEFATYLTGALAYHRGNLVEARMLWEGLLRLPKADRLHRSTWAVFMLGKSYLETEPARAELYFQQVRALVLDHYLDSLSLAAASYGWEALAESKQGHLTAALRLYLTQQRTGDPSAAPSLRMTVRKLLEDSTQRAEAAADPVAQQIVTAYLVSRRTLLDMDAPQTSADLVRQWLEAIERAGLTEVAAADRIALAAYQRGLFDQAERWLAHANPRSAMTLWLRSKFLLRAGKVQPAVQMLAQVIRTFPREGEWTTPTRIQKNTEGEEDWDESPLRQSMGEYGVLLLARRNYYEALDTLLRAGYWTDAAYVAEYVLTPDELAAYVQRQWAEPEPEQSAEATLVDQKDPVYEGLIRPQDVRKEIRYLTARRLARLERWNEAADFYPAKYLPRLQSFVAALARGRDLTVGQAERAQSLWDAALIARHEGMELFGTEVEPDWHQFEGQFDCQHVSAVRQLASEGKGTFNWPTNGGGWAPEKVTITLAPW